jgi:hypothetical protein
VSAQHQGQRRHDAELTGVGVPNVAHEHEVVVGVPEPGFRAGVQVRRDRADEQERDESHQEREDTASRHGPKTPRSAIDCKVLIGS